MHHKTANETHLEKARWEQEKSAARCLEQVLTAAFDKTAVLRPPTAHLKNHLSMTNKTCWALLGGSKDELISDVLIWTPTPECARVL